MDFEEDFDEDINDINEIDEHGFEDIDKKYRDLLFSEKEAKWENEEFQSLFDPLN